MRKEFLVATKKLFFKKKKKKKKIKDTQRKENLYIKETSLTINDVRLDTDKRMFVNS